MEAAVDDEESEEKEFIKLIMMMMRDDENDVYDVNHERGVDVLNQFLRPVAILLKMLTIIWKLRMKLRVIKLMMMTMKRRMMMIYIL